MAAEGSVSIVELAPQAALTMRFRAAPAELGPRMGEVFPAIYTWAMEQGVEVTGPRFARYHEHDEAAGEFDVEAGMPVAAESVGSDEIAASELPGGRTATLLHVGPYEKLGESHGALCRWLEETGEARAGGPWESYVTDPGEEPDPSRWKTQLFQPLQDAGRS